MFLLCFVDTKTIHPNYDWNNSYKSPVAVTSTTTSQNFIEISSDEVR